MVVANVPSVHCPDHGVITISVPWADAQVQYTRQFEAHVIDELYDATSHDAVEKRMGVSWTMIFNIVDRAVERGIARKEQEKVEHICVCVL